ncbi:chemotaxis protein CheW [Ruminiclostridium hungatei]|uniref:Chemotaxis protein CheW n=1 Tax=Ruminiclostridium hungatei TaxID=48256 RepID=A0A1V4SRF4_RUMHU|nr:chemotaxis protein CheW [Ruminiclostridium hungatei]OPX46460.1 chemotaxis protein CheW [Ruminiclostridium hungatei]
MADIQVVVFTLNNELCSVEASMVFKIEKYGEVSHIPEMPDYIKGLYDLRGRVVPIVDLNKKFNMGASEITKKTKIIISEKDGQLFGFMVNNVLEIINLNEASIDRSDAIIKVNNKKYITGVGKKDEKLFSIIDLNEILRQDEVEQVTEVITVKE